MDKNRPSLPVKRVFVLQVHTDARVEQGQWKGRVEHVISGEATHFHSLEDLVAFVVQVLTAQQD